MPEPITKEYCENMHKNLRMSSETKEKIEDLENITTKMQDNIEKIKESQVGQAKDLEYMRLTMNKMEMSINKFIEGADEKYASKGVEKIVFGLVGAILLSFIYAVWKLIINK
jgi:hypothetical protein